MGVSDGEAGTKPAEYKQVTVLFADVVHSMNFAATVGAEWLREINDRAGPRWPLYRWSRRKQTTDAEGPSDRAMKGL
ncbi:MAG TPA: hypothetical protein VED43_03915 [Mycobacterium sp.]|nr:hypothetical protein [Mycobacterium sp.]